MSINVFPTQTFVLGTDRLLRPREVVLEGGTILKQAPFWGVNFFTRKKHEGGSNFMAQQQQSKEFEVSDLSSTTWLVYI